MLQFVHLIILLLVIILDRLDLFLLHLLGLLLALAVQLGPAVHLISLGILKLSGLRKCIMHKINIVQAS